MMDNVAVLIGAEHFQQLIDALRRRSYRVIGPVLRDGAIIYDDLASASDLPKGWTDEQAAGAYRVKPRADEALFGYAVGPHSWKKFLRPTRTRLWQAKREGGAFHIIPESEPEPAFAFIGVRSCELHAMAIEDRVFGSNHASDPRYQTRREPAFIVAVNCGQAGGTCFCASMNTGPEATAGFDLILTEVLEDRRHCFIARAGTDKGAEVLRELPTREANDSAGQQVKDIVARTAAEMGRTMDTRGIKELLYQNLEHPQWDNIAERCLACGNCTMVCPTCFCTTVEDVTDLTGENAERWRSWDSCFTLDFSHIHGGSVRSSTKARYRQWMTHKLASWFDQFGTSGCVGCGRCITWCPVGIDITAEVRAIRGSESEPHL